MSHSHKFHVPVEEPEAPVQAAEPAAVESVNSSETEANQGEEMVTKQTMTIDRFLLGTHPMAHPQ